MTGRACRAAQQIKSSCRPGLPLCLHLPIGTSMRRLKVLLVEDDADARGLYGYMLALAGYRVKVVSNGLEAFVEIQVERPDVIVTDIAMPVLSGVDLITALRSNHELADLPVVAITSLVEKPPGRGAGGGADRSNRQADRTGKNA